MKKISLYSAALVMCLFFYQTDLLAQKEKKELGKQHILQLEKTAMVVVLMTGSNKINSLEKSNQQEKADVLKNENRQKQLELIQVFKRNFTFCEVYFIFNTDLQKAKAGNLNDVLLDDSLEYNFKLQNHHPNFYFCRIGEIYFETFGTTMDGIALYDSSFNMLDPPFPYYLRRHYSLTFVHRDDDELVFEFNDRLLKYQDKTQK